MHRARAACLLCAAAVSLPVAGIAAGWPSGAMGADGAVGATGADGAVGATGAGGAMRADGAAGAAPRVTLKMRFRPYRLGQATTIHYGFTVSAPAPLRTLALHLPAGMGFAATSLGIEECLPETLAAAGPKGCPADSMIGFGRAVAVVPARTPTREKTKVTAYMAPPDGEAMTVLFSIEGSWPLRRQVTLTAQLRHLAARHGATLRTQAPPLPAWPGGPEIGLIGFHSTIGPQGLIYHRRVGGRTVAFKPRGVSVPDRCPRGGFPVSAVFRWWGIAGTSVAKARVACPRKRGRHGRERRGPGRRRRG